MLNTQKIKQNILETVRTEQPIFLTSNQHAVESKSPEKHQQQHRNMRDSTPTTTIIVVHMGESGDQRDYANLRWYYLERQA